MSAFFLLNLVSISLITVAQSTILDVRPLFGPHAGGTMIAISFNNTEDRLHRFRVYVGDRSCNNLMVVLDQSVVLCETKPSGRRVDDDVTAIITVVTPDGTEEQYKSPFMYKANPSIETVYPAVAFLEGGTHQTIIGRNFDSVAFPAMHVFYKNISYLKDLYDIHKYPACDVVNSTFMLCTVPKTVKEIQLSIMSSGDTHINDDMDAKSDFLNNRRNEWYMTFYLDGTVLGTFEEYRLKMAENPKVFPWQPETLQFEGKDIIIKGQKLNYGAKDEDFNVTLGTITCPIIQLSPNTIRCQLHEQSPEVHALLGAKYKVKVQIGLDLEYTVGYLKFGSSFWENKMLRIVLLSSLAGVLLMLFMGILISCRLRQLKARRKIKDQS